jgi:hypothetical protein
VGWVLIRFYPKRLNLVLAALKKHPLKSLGMGVMLMIVLPLLSLLLLITILGAPFAIALMGLSAVFFYAAKTIPILTFCNKYLTKLHLEPNTLSIFAIGLVIYFLLVRIPYIGILIALTCLLLGVGASAFSRSQKR